MQKYEQIKVLGEGGYGKAYLLKRKSDGLLCVDKSIKLAGLSEAEKKETMNEVKVLSALRHPYIVSYIESFTERGNLHIIMEYADGGDLSQKIEKQHGRYFSENDILDIFSQLALAIKYIHDRKILHRDLKGQNVFLTKKGEVKLGDFGIAKVLDHTMQFCKTQIGTPYYISPEICEGKSYNSKTDIWSLGCVIYEMCTLKHAFNGRDINGLFMNIKRGRFAPIPSIYSQQLKSLVESMLEKDPAKRPSANQIVLNPLIRNRLTLFLSEVQLKREMEHTVFHGKSPFDPEVRRQDLAEFAGNEEEEKNFGSDNSSPASRQQQQRPKPILNQNLIKKPTVNRSQTPIQAQQQQPKVMLSPEEIARKREEDAKKVLEREERLRKRAAQLDKNKGGQSPYQRSPVKPPQNDEDEQRRKLYEQRRLQREENERLRKQKEEEEKRIKQNEEIEYQKKQILEQQKRNEALRARQQEQKRLEEERNMKDEEERRLIRERKKQELEERRRQEEEEKKQIAQKRMLEMKRQKEEAERKRKEYELKRQQEFEEQQRLEHERQEKKEQERIKHEQEMIRYKQDFEEKERIKREKQEEARKLAEEKWLQAKEEAAAEKRRKNEERRRKAEEFDRQQQEFAEQRAKERIKRQQEMIEEQQRQQEMQKQRRQVNQPLSSRVEKKQDFNINQKRRAQMDDFVRRPAASKYSQDNDNDQYQRYDRVVPYDRDDRPIKPAKNGTYFQEDQVPDRPRQRVSFPETDMEQEKLNPRLKDAAKGSGFDSFFESQQSNAPKWVKEKLNKDEQEFSIADVRKFQKEHPEEIKSARKEREMEDELMASIKEAIEVDPKKAEDDVVVGEPSKIYDGDKVVNLTVANDVGSLMSRAEELRCKIEERLGQEKMLQLRRELIGIDEPKIAKEVDPLSFFFMQQLLYLDEEIEQMSH